MRSCIIASLCIKYCWVEKFKELACYVRHGKHEKLMQSFVGKLREMESVGMCMCRGVVVVNCWLDMAKDMV
jgi:hypothetical protein